MNGQGRQTRLLIGTGVLSIGLSLQLTALNTPALPLVVTVVGWSFSGLGTGLAHAASSVLAFAAAPKGEEGPVSSALQLADTLTVAVSTGVGEALFALASEQLWGERWGVGLAFAFNLLLVGLGVLAASRSRIPLEPKATLSQNPVAD